MLFTIGREEKMSADEQKQELREAAKAWCNSPVSVARVPFTVYVKGRLGCKLSTLEANEVLFSIVDEVRPVEEIIAMNHQA